MTDALATIPTALPANPGLDGAFLKAEGRG
jgi:hypothetical protein